mmetsp:Transcript_19123/g.49038  ORF Transcript_19123/g.49038 Transcript_19123/m.49038 type:complete len:233 (-) Transcript_19123:303-1001(-)
MCDFCRITPTTGASFGMPARGMCTFSYHSLYSAIVSVICGASGCQMPWSGSTTGSMIFSMSTAPCAMVGTKPPATRMSIASRFSGVPPSQCCSESTKARASFACSPGKNFSTFGSVRTSFRRLSWKAPPAAAGLPSCRPWLRMSLICCAKLPSGPPEIFVRSKVPSLFSFMISGIDGKQRQASSVSRYSATTAASFSASSCTKMSEQTKMLASAMSLRSSSSVAGLRISSSR